MKKTILLAACIISTPIFAKYDDNQALTECNKLTEQATKISSLQKNKMCKSFFTEIKGTYRTACYRIKSDRIEAKVQLGYAMDYLENSSQFKCSAQDKVKTLSLNTQSLSNNL